jgi:phenylacetate-CoA ligase
MPDRDHYDERETRPMAARDAEIAARLPAVVAAAMRAPKQAERLSGVDPAAVADRAALARLPLLRKSDLPALQAEAPPFGGLFAAPPGAFPRLFASPGPIHEPQPAGADPYRMARALHAAGFRAGDVVLNTFGYHMTPGGWIMDSGARALGCAVIPAGPGSTAQQLDLLAHYRPAAYCGTPDFLKILLDAADAAGRPAGSLRKAMVSGAAFPPSLRQELAGRGVEAFQCYATAELGCVAYETVAREGLVLNEDIVVEIVRPGTGDPVPEGEIGEVVVTVLDPQHPVLRLALGDLSGAMPGASPCGRTNTRILGWRGRADQTTKVRGMFVHPEQVAEIVRRHKSIIRARLVVERPASADQMTLHVEMGEPAESAAAIAESAQSVTKLRTEVTRVPEGSLPNDGKVIEDRRPIG